jgi:prephenate dehydrogenase
VSGGTETRPVVGVLGLGLIGGSLAQAWAATGGDVVGWSRSAATRDLAAAAGLAVTASPADVVGRADIVVLATPLSVLPDTLDDVAAALADRADPPTITDVGSVKGPIAAHARAVLADPSIFVPGHPMAGTEHAGWTSARPDLFRGATWALGVDEPTDLGRWTSVARVVLAVGGVVVPISCDEHDEAVALVSHLPYALAGVLSTLLDDEPTGLPSALAAGSFASATRVVRGDGRGLGVELARANAAHLRPRLVAMQSALGALVAALEVDDVATLETLFRRAGRVAADPPVTPGAGRLDPVELTRDRLLASGRRDEQICGIAADGASYEALAPGARS